MALSWVLDILWIDLRRVKLWALILNALVLGPFGAVFAVGSLWTMGEAKDAIEVAERVVICAIGIGIIARLVQGFVYYARYTRTGTAPPADA